MNISLISTYGARNIGDEIIRQGIINLVNERYPNDNINFHHIDFHYYHINKKLYRHLFEKSDIIIFCGMPVIYAFDRHTILRKLLKILSNFSYLISKRTFLDGRSTSHVYFRDLLDDLELQAKSGKDIRFLGIGSHYKITDNSDDIINDQVILDLIKRIANISNRLSVREKRLQEAFSKAGLENTICLPCPGFWSVKATDMKTEPNEVYAVNIMPKGTHHLYQGDVFSGEECYKALKKRAEETKKRFVMVAHNEEELESYLNWSINRDDIFFSNNYKDYIAFYSSVKAIIANRVHGAICGCSAKKKVLLFGNDSRIMTLNEAEMQSYPLSQMVNAWDLIENVEVDYTILDDKRKIYLNNLI